jgi:hypothetical protein
MTNAVVNASEQNALVNDLLELLAEDPRNVEARKLLVTQYEEAGWHDSARGAARDLLHDCGSDAEVRALCDRVLPVPTAPVSPPPPSPAEPQGRGRPHATPGPRIEAASLSRPMKELPPLDSVAALEDAYERLRAMNESLLLRAQVLHAVEDPGAQHGVGTIIDHLERLLGDTRLPAPAPTSARRGPPTWLGTIWDVQK